MKYIIESFVVIISIGLLAMYFTSSDPRVEAMTDSETQLILTLYKRIQNVEKAIPDYKVSDDLKLKINGVPE